MMNFDRFANEFTFWSERVNPPRYDVLFESLAPLAVETALDAGCGAGDLAAHLTRHARRVVGVDLAAGMVALARRRHPQAQAPGLQFLVGDIARLPFEPGSFDLVVSDCALHCLPLETALPALAGLLRPGGRLVVRDLVWHDPQRQTQLVWRWWQVFRRTPRYLRQFGWRVGARLAVFEASPAWVRHHAAFEHLSPGAFQDRYRQRLPGCRFVDFGFALAAYWQKP